MSLKELTNFMIMKKFIRLYGHIKLYWALSLIFYFAGAYLKYWDVWQMIGMTPPVALYLFLHPYLFEWEKKYGSQEVRDRSKII